MKESIQEVSFMGIGIDIPNLILMLSCGWTTHPDLHLAISEHSIGTIKIAQNIAFEHKMLIGEVNTDRGTQFYSIKHILSRRNNPQTNGRAVLV